MAEQDDSSANTLGLAFDKLKVESKDDVKTTPTEQPATKPADEEVQEKRKPYINPERVKTGGAQRDKLTEDELTERMARIKEQNEKIKQRRLDVEADEAAFKQMQQAERARIAQNKKVQASVDRTREQNAQRKMDKIQSREWDSGKKAADWKNSRPAQPTPPVSDPAPAQDEQPAAEGSSSNTNNVGDGQWQRGGSRGGRTHRGGRGRGRGASNSRVPATTTTTDAASPTTQEASSPPTDSSPAPDTNKV